MTDADLQTLADRHTDAWRRRDPVALAANHSRDGVVESPMFATLRGRNAIEDAYRALFTSFPDWDLTVDKIVIAAPLVRDEAVGDLQEVRSLKREPFLRARHTEEIVDKIVIAAPQIALFSTSRATHVNDFFGVSGTQKRFTLQAANLLEIADGLIAHERRLYDFTGLLVQIGVLRAKPAKP